MNTAQYWIDHLNLTKHPEGGYFKEVYRSTELISKASLPNRYSDARCFGTSIYFLLGGSEFSTFHRLASDEIWHFHTGTTAKVYEIDTRSGELITHHIGSNVTEGDRFQVVIKAGNWFAAEVIDKSSFILVGCTVAPGFDFADFEMTDRTTLSQEYPQYSELIKNLT